MLCQTFLDPPNIDKKKATRNNLVCKIYYVAHGKYLNPSNNSAPEVSGFSNFLVFCKNLLVKSVQKNGKMCIFSNNFGKLCMTFRYP